MASYTIRVTLDSGYEVKYGISNSTIDPVIIADSYTTQEYQALSRILTRWVGVMRTANLKKVEIEREE